MAGCSVVVTRPEVGRLGALLVNLGATIVHASAIAFVPPQDDGRALRAAIEAWRAGGYEWVVVTSSTAVDVLANAVGDLATLPPVPIAAVGPATARAVKSAGGDVVLVPPEAVGELLVDVFPTAAQPGARVLQLRPEVAREVVAQGLAGKGWQVDEVAAYRTVPVAFTDITLRALREADVVTFASPSTVTAVLDAIAVADLPSMVVSIGPVTSDALRARGVEPTANADPHTVDGLVEAVLACVGRGGSVNPS